MEVEEDAEIHNGTEKIKWGGFGESEEYADFARYETPRCKKSGTNKIGAVHTYAFPINFSVDRNFCIYSCRM